MLKTIKTLFLLIIFSTTLPSYAKDAKPPCKPNEPMEELEEIEWFIKHPPSGIIFTLREYEEDAFSWVAVRLNYYIYKLRNTHPKLRIAILAHGDEVGSLSNSSVKEYTKLHYFIQSWDQQEVVTHVCGSMAHLLGLDEDSFPDYIDVVPYGPSQIKDYVELGYEHIELELTW